MHKIDIEMQFDSLSVLLFCKIIVPFSNGTDL